MWTFSRASGLAGNLWYFTEECYTSFVCPSFHSSTEINKITHWCSVKFALQIFDVVVYMYTLYTMNRKSCILGLQKVMSDRTFANICLATGKVDKGISSFSLNLIQPKIWYISVYRSNGCIRRLLHMLPSERGLVLNIITNGKRCNYHLFMEAGASDVCQRGFFQQLRSVAV